MTASTRTAGKRRTAGAGAAPTADRLDDSSPVTAEELWEHREAIHRLCQQIVGDAATADDVVQETYLRALANLDRLERRPSLMPWLATVARRCSIDVIRSRRHSMPVDIVPETRAARDDEPEVRVPVAETVEHVREALAVLNERERRLLARQVNDGLSLAELAAEDGTSVHSVRSVLVRARAKLRDAIVGDGVTVPAFAPVAAVVAWAKRRLGPLGARVQQGTPVAIGGADRFGEIVAAGVAVLVLGTTAGGPVAPAASDPDTTPIAGIAAVPDTTPSAGREVPGPQERTEPEVQPDDDHAPVIPGGSAVDLLLPPDDAQEPEDARFTSFATGSSSGSRSGVVLAAGERRGGCVTGCTVLFRSDDGGGTWERLEAKGITGTTIAVAPGYPDDPRVFAVGDLGFSVSRDGGRTFEHVVTLPGATHLAVSPGFSNGDERVVVGSSPGWSYDDTTGALTPLAIPSSPTARQTFVFAPDYEDSGRSFAASMSPDGVAAVYRCDWTLGTDACSQYSSLDGFERSPRLAVSTGFDRDQTVFAWQSTDLFRSTDAGSTFVAVALPAPVRINGVIDDGAGTFYAAVSGLGEHRGGIAVSRDSGGTWVVTETETLLDRGVAALAVLPDGRLLAAPLDAAGGGLWCSADGGQSWAPRCEETS